MPASTAAAPDVAIVGGGIVGCACAWLAIISANGAVVISRRACQLIVFTSVLPMTFRHIRKRLVMVFVCDRNGHCSIQFSV